MTLPFIVPDWPAPATVRSLVTTRQGGCSRGAWRSLNLGDRCGDEPSRVSENRRRLGQHLPATPAWLRQAHGTNVIRFDERGAAGEADAVIATAPLQPCAVLSADCLPVLFTNRSGTRVAAAHAGWRGLAAGILERTVIAMDCDPALILAWLGPAIGPRHFQVGGEVREAFAAADPQAVSAFTPDGERWRADLYALAVQRLAASGVRHVFGGGRCTFSDPELFFSYRRDGVTGRMASLVWIGIDSTET